MLFSGWLTGKQGKMDEDHQGSEVTNVSADLQKVNKDEASVKKRSVKLTQSTAFQTRWLRDTKEIHVK